MDLRAARLISRTSWSVVIDSSPTYGVNIISIFCVYIAAADAQRMRVSEPYYPEVVILPSINALISSFE